PDLVRAGKRDADRAEVIDFEHGSPPRRRLARRRDADRERAASRRPRRDAAGIGSGTGSTGSVAVDQSSNPARLIPPRSGRRYPEASSSASGISSSFGSRISALRPRLRSSLMSTLNDSGTRGGWISSPLTMASYVWTRPRTSSDLTVSSSWRMFAAP